MSDPVISITNLGKRYVIGHQRAAGDGIRHVVEDAMRAPLKWLRSRAKNKSREREEFWALKDVSFEVKQGEVVGIIGRNGAGKSTLLKILSRITEPTIGKVEIEGRVASLLEVGTGFHQELTGRENIFLNGAILGMSHAEIKRKFDEIVAFAEVEKFLDTPVKRYSSGMYVRLAFAVAAHLEPEILIVDEVLAVGDIEFQKKCLGKMENVARQGRTVLFVSHNMAAMRSLCTRGILFEKGRLTVSSTMEVAIDSYLSDRLVSRGELAWDLAVAPRNESILFAAAYLKNNQEQILAAIDCSDPFIICLEYEVMRPIRNLRIGIMIETATGLQVCGSNSEEITHRAIVRPGRYLTQCCVPSFVLNTGTYVIRLAADSPPEMPALWSEEYLTLNIEDAVGHGPNHLPLPGIVRPRLRWSSVDIGAEAPRRQICESA
jgi:lipopolysaccharide transport system ATP-binding protein